MRQRKDGFAKMILSYCHVMETDEPDDTLVIGSTHQLKMKAFTELEKNDIFDPNYLFDCLDKCSQHGMNLNELNNYLIRQ